MSRLQLSRLNSARLLMIGRWLRFKSHSHCGHHPRSASKRATDWMVDWPIGQQASLATSDSLYLGRPCISLCNCNLEQGELQAKPLHVLVQSNSWHGIFVSDMLQVTAYLRGRVDMVIAMLHVRCIFACAVRARVCRNFGMDGKGLGCICLLHIWQRLASQ